MVHLNTKVKNVQQLHVLTSQQVLWEEVKAGLVEETAKLKVGDVRDFRNPHGGGGRLRALDLGLDGRHRAALGDATALDAQPRDVGGERARLGREPAAAGNAVADIGRGKSNGREQRHAERDQPDRPGGRGRHDVVVTPKLRGGARQHDGEEIDGEPDGREQDRGFRGLAERGRKPRVDGEPDDGQAGGGEPQHQRQNDAAGAAPVGRCGH